MNAAPILRSSALQKALALTPVARPSGQSGVSFASTLAKARASATTAPRPSAPRARTFASAVTSPPLDASAPIPFQSEIVAAAQKYGVDPALLAGLVKQESNFNPRAQSGVGAKGLTQLMDATARGLGVSDVFDPTQSLDAGAKFLGGLLKQFHGDERLALAAYNAGPGAVQKYGGIPPYEETQRYVPKVLGYAAQFRRIIGA
jgi:soluble lytic murein transglycosylase-like protein